MSRTTKSLFILLAVAFGPGGVASLLGADPIRDAWAELGVSDSLGTLIALLEILAAIGLVIGLRRPRIGIAAAGGIIALMIGAVVYHVRAEDWAGLAGPITLGLLAAAATYTARNTLHRASPPIQRRSDSTTAPVAGNPAGPVAPPGVIAPDRTVREHRWRVATGTRQRYQDRRWSCWGTTSGHGSWTGLLDGSGGQVGLAHRGALCSTGCRTLPGAPRSPPATSR